MSDETFGDEVRRRRGELELSQRELAELAGVRPETVGKVERGAPFRQVTRRCLIRALDAVENGDDTPSRATTEPAQSIRETIARTLEAIADGLPEELVAADSASPEAVALRSARRAYRHAARIARGEDL